MPKWLLVLSSLCLVGILATAIFGITQLKKPVKSEVVTSKLSLNPLPSPTPTATPSPSPTPRPLTFAEMNEKYGPCLSLPVLMYHHVQPEDQALEKGQTSLTVYSNIFRDQMQYLKDNGYNTILPHDLKDFFENGSIVPAKSILLTVDDGYDDNFHHLFPIIKEFGFKATIFLSTGLMENPGYLSWNQIREMSDYGIYFGNHTWSHQNMKTNSNLIEKEVGTAATQLSDHGLDADKVFAFPYGLMSGQADNYLTSQTYSMAFDTLPGRILCAKKKYALPRIRVGNTKLSSYGL